MYATRGQSFTSAGRGYSFGALAPMTDDQIRRLAPSVFQTEKHESRSQRFCYVPTFEILAGLRKEGFDVVNAVQGRSRVAGKSDFTKHMLRLRHRDFGQMDKMGGVAPEALLLNAHDGTSSYRLMSGVLRAICLNANIVWQDGAQDFRVGHTGDILGKVIEGTFEVIGEGAKAIEIAQDWQGITLNTDERMALAEAAHALRFGDDDGEPSTPIQARQLLAPRRREDVGTDLWLTHNILQENSLRGGLHAVGRDANGRRRQTTTREINGIDQSVRLNKALWVLSAKMAQIKAGITV